jgi:hypothetical protein
MPKVNSLMLNLWLETIDFLSVNAAILNLFFLIAD